MRERGERRNIVNYSLSSYQIISLKPVNVTLPPLTGIGPRSRRMTKLWLIGQRKAVSDVKAE